MWGQVVECEGSAFYTLPRKKKIARRPVCIAAATSQRTKEAHAKSRASQRSSKRQAQSRCAQKNPDD
jgi:hypothetical protein